MSYQTHYDVVIIGAGPAGLECAKGFIDSGKSVLVIEKKAVFGTKVCGGAVTFLADTFAIPDEITQIFPTIKVKINEKSFDLKLKKPIRTLIRHDFEQYMFEVLKSSENIDVITGLKVEKIFDDRVVTKEGEFFYKTLVGADGSDSIVRKFLGLKSEFRRGLQYHIANAEGNLEWAVFPEKTGSGYLWIFPNKRGVNVGIYFDEKRLNSKEAVQILNEFTALSGLTIDGSKIGYGKIEHNYCGVEFGSVFLIGDAAGLPLKNTGEGIPGALISGREVAKKIVHKNYNMVELKKYLKLKNRQEMLLKVFEAIPFLQTFFFKLYGAYKKL
ncbi:MAG: FAD-dependent oxidoreductase [bacterium]